VWLAVIGVLVGLAAPAVAAPSPEQRRREIDVERQRLRAQLGEVAEQEADVLAELEITRRTRRELDAKLAALDAEIGAAEVAMGSVTLELEAALAAEQAAARAVEAARAQLAEARGVLQAQAVQAFIRFGSRPSLDHLLARVEDVNEAPRVAAYVEAVAERQSAVVDQHRRLQRDTTALELEASRSRAAVTSRRDDLARQKTALEQARTEQAAARAEVQAEAATEEALLASITARRGEYERRLRDLERQSADIAAELRRRQAGQGITPSGRGVLRAPLASPSITSSYGWRVHPIYGDRRLHAGIDLRGATGTPILAAGDGVVAFAGWRGGYGNTVIVDHGGSLATLYAHQSAVSVGSGQAVSRGQVLGGVGSTGNSTGPHLHFEVRVSGTPVDPMNYL
jgi:murein DD-endopeptidase MepM/ murein hydrolase activator NlpD